MDTGAENVPGNFVWRSLATSNPQAALDFYCGAFGWRAEADGPNWSLWTGDELIGTLTDKNADPTLRTQPPNWMPCVRVLQLEAVIGRAEELGGAVRYPPFEAPGCRVAMIRAATGEVLGLCQPAGRAHVLAAGATAWHELVTPDPVSAKRYYQALFGWRFTNEGAYTVLTNGSQPIGGVVRLEGDWEDFAFLQAIGQARGEKWHIPPHWMPFFRVGDCEAFLRQAEALGAQVTTRPDELHTFGRFAVVRDPQGVYFSILARMEE